MAYYNRNYEKLKLNGMKYLNSGNCAKIFYKQGIIVKEYYSETIYRCRLSAPMFDQLKNINHPNFIKLFDIYHDFDLLELMKNKITPFHFLVDAYTAQYYLEDSTNILQKQKDYLLENFRELEKLFNIFTEQGICTGDVKRKNTVIENDRIIMIDPDLFYQSKDSKIFISIANKKNLFHLFQSIFIDYFQEHPYNPDLISEIDFISYMYKKLPNMEITENTIITDEISKNLKYVKKPIDLFKK